MARTATGAAKPSPVLIISTARGDDQTAFVARSDSIFGPELLRERVEQLRQTDHGLVFVILRVGEEPFDLPDGLRRRSVADHSLSEGDCAGMLTNEFSHHRDDR